MEYFFYVNKTWDNLINIEPYIVKRYKNNTVSKVAFDDGRYDDFIKDLKVAELIEKHGGFIVFGSDGYFYNITPSGAIKGDKYPSNQPKFGLKLSSKMYKSFQADWKFKKKALSEIKYGNTEKISNGILGFNKYQYINNEKNFVMPYRLKRARNKNQPLVVYLAGAGTIGHDNFKQLWEFLFYAGGGKVYRKNCNILIPQTMRAWDVGDSDIKSRNIVADNCADLVKQLISENDIDTNRIYIYGSSLGAGEVWNSLLNSANLYAAAVEAMGEYIEYEKLTNADFEKISHIPIWLAHSSDDFAVKIASDDYFYNKLKLLGANVKYTRWDKYGHKMSAKFYKQEPWVDWLFEQSK